MVKSLEKTKSYFRDWHWCAESTEGLGAFIRSVVCNEDDSAVGGTQINNSNKKSVTLCTFRGNDGMEMPLAVKRNNDRRFFRYFLRPSQALKEARGFQLVKSLGIPCIDFVGCGDFRNFFALSQSYFVTLYERNTYQLSEYEPGHSLEGEHSEGLGVLKEVLGQMAMLHKAGYRHGGAHGRNFLCRKRPDLSIEVLWIDLVTLRRFSGFHKTMELITDLCDVIEYFDLTDEELGELQRHYSSLSGYSVRFEKIPSPKRKLNRCVIAASK